MSSLPTVLPKYLNGICVFNISILSDCVTALNLWNNTSGPINPKFIALITDLQTAQSPKPGKTNPYAAVGKIAVTMSLMYRTKEAFATWQYEDNGIQKPEYLKTMPAVLSLIDQYEIGMYAPQPGYPIIV